MFIAAAFGEHAGRGPSALKNVSKVIKSLLSSIFVEKGGGGRGNGEGFASYANLNGRQLNEQLRAKSTRAAYRALSFLGHRRCL